MKNYIINYFGFFGYPCTQTVQAKNKDVFLLHLQQNVNFANVIDVKEEDLTIYTNYANLDVFKALFANANEELENEK